MPIVEDTSSTPPALVPVPVQVTAPEFRGATVDTAYTPATSLLTHIEGASWTVNYYSQVLGTDNALSSQNVDRPAAYQQYKLIQGLELKVTTPLNSTQDQTTKEFNVTGQANMYPCGLIPNEGDCLLADVGDGREAVFEITSTERRSIYKDAAFIVDYKLVAYSDQDNRAADLNSKVVESLHYVADFLEHGQKPLIVTDEYLQIQQLNRYYREIVDFYFNRFFSKEYGILTVPGQDYVIYDPFLTQAVLEMFRDEPHPNIKYIRELNVAEDENYLTPTVWTALKNKRRKELVGGMTQVGLVSTRQFSTNPVYNSIRYANVDFAIYPIDPLKTDDYRRQDLSKTLADISFAITNNGLTSLVDLIQNTELNGLPEFTAPAVNPSQNNTYVFSPSFYNQSSTGQSALELAFQNYLDDKAIDGGLLTQLCVSYTSWARMEQFYQLPFLLAMVKAFIRRM